MNQVLQLFPRLADHLIIPLLPRHLLLPIVPWHETVGVDRYHTKTRDNAPEYWSSRFSDTICLRVICYQVKRNPPNHGCECFLHQSPYFDRIGAVIHAESLTRKQFFEFVIDKKTMQGFSGTPYYIVLPQFYPRRMPLIDKNIATLGQKFVGIRTTRDKVEVTLKAGFDYDASIICRIDAATASWL